MLSLSERAIAQAIERAFAKALARVLQAKAEKLFAEALSRIIENCSAWKSIDASFKPRKKD